ncbi:cytochrome c [Xinfangfangia sp. CPCC 101601]|uniref:Cytochrome c n=1 Tax=Pseudogemmobacter lacusdianii TaxID=3069608 RepID=A0ABU0VUS4_9RHOB|nr:cytochrome c [Xinfangfangia sp. CPCC 101601]MDQ2065482.1 cytochrome c [Xinfangfangia sp. CPCC 101601]
MKLKFFTVVLTVGLMSQSAAFGQDFVQSGTAPTLPQREGKEIYNAICSGCHMPDGVGAVGAAAYPPLAKSDFVGSKEATAQWVIKGYKAMPPLGDVMDDEQIAAVVNYVRTNLGNAYDDEELTAAEVADIRTW